MTSSPTSPSSLWRHCQLPTGAASATSPLTSSAGNSRFGGAGRSWSCLPKLQDKFWNLRSWKCWIAKLFAPQCELCARSDQEFLYFARFYFLSLSRLSRISRKQFNSLSRMQVSFRSWYCFGNLMMLFSNICFFYISFSFVILTVFLILIADFLCRL